MARRDRERGWHRNAPMLASQPPRLSALAQQFMLQRFCPASVLINRQAEVLYLSGPIDLYLQAANRRTGRRLDALARDGLRTKLRAAVQQAIRDERPVTIDRRSRQTRQVLLSGPNHHRTHSARRRRPKVCCWSRLPKNGAGQAADPCHCRLPTTLPAPDVQMRREGVA